MVLFWSQLHWVRLANMLDLLCPHLGRCHQTQTSRKAVRLDQSRGLSLTFFTMSLHQMTREKWQTRVTKVCDIFFCAKGKPNGFLKAPIIRECR